MYKWDKKIIKIKIDYLNSLSLKTQQIEDALEILKSLNKKIILNKKDTKETDTTELLFIKEKAFTNKIISKYNKEKILLPPNYKKIIASSKDKLLLIQDILKDNNINCYKTLLPFFNDEKHINIDKYNENFIYYIEYINEYYISISKKDNITDFTNIIHEFMHIYSNILNKKSFNKIESELLSIFGEFIILDEIYNKCLFGIESLKAQINDVAYILNYIEKLKIRTDIIEKKYLNQNHLYDNQNIKNLYLNSYFYLNSTVISYFIAIELFNIYKQDKEKAIVIAENIIKDNDPLQNKLKKNNIKILSNSDAYIKKIKKEYTKYNQ